MQMLILFASRLPTSLQQTSNQQPDMSEYRPKAKQKIIPNAIPNQGWVQWVRVEAYGRADIYFMLEVGHLRNFRIDVETIFAPSGVWMVGGGGGDCTPTAPRSQGVPQRGDKKRK